MSVPWWGKWQVKEKKVLKCSKGKRFISDEPSSAAICNDTSKLLPKMVTVLNKPKMKRSRGPEERISLQGWGLTLHNGQIPSDLTGAELSTQIKPVSKPLQLQQCLWVTVLQSRTHPMKWDQGTSEQPTESISSGTERKKREYKKNGTANTMHRSEHMHRFARTATAHGIHPLVLV